MQRLSLVALCAAFFFACSTKPEAPPVNQLREALTLPDGTCGVTVAVERELMIRDLPVVEDPLRTRWTGGTANPSDGAWTFGRLMSSMAGANSAPQFTRRWLSAWENNQSVNGFSVFARPNMKSLVTDPWLASSGGAVLDLTRAPFRLLAIVNRLDLNNLPNGSAGEGRFVFGVLDPAGNTLPFTVIFEYRLPATTQADVNRWVTDWHNLGSLPLGSPAYNQALETLTNRFAGANAAPGRINGSSISQVRTNEIALSAPWELREFRLDAAGQLSEGPVMQTADLGFNNTPTLANFANTNQAALLAGTHVVPASFNGVPFQAGSALTPPGLFWSAPGIINNDARFMFSVNTCNGCHAGETGTAFLHVAPRALGAPSVLSGFLTGRTQPDPVSGAPRAFNDLDRRSRAFNRQICATLDTGTVTITSPANGASVSGTVTLAATSTVVAGQLQFFVDGAPVGPRLLAPPFSVPWFTGSVPFGSHAITATAFDALGVPTTSAPVTVLTAPTNAPDFVITDVKGPAIVAPGSSFVAQVTVCNQGNLSGSATVDAVLSADAIIDPAFPFSSIGDRLVGGAFVSLSPTECQQVSINAFANPPGPGITWFLGAVADLANNVIELSESNNRKAGNQMAIAVGPDLIVTDVKGPPTALPGSLFTAQVTVCNQGNQSSFALVDLVFSSDNIISVAGGDRMLGGASANLGPSQCQTLSISASASLNGLWFLGAVVDNPNLVAELNETNNTNAGRQMGIGFGPDFAVTDVKGPASALPGSPFTAQVTVCNQGTAFGFTNIDLVLSADAVITPPSIDRLVGGASLGLSAGQCVVQNVQGFANAPGPTGLFFLGAIADFPNQALELNETNNTNAGLQVGIGVGADFVITDVKGPASVLPFALLSAQVTVCNQGTAFGQSNVDLVLSSDSVINPTLGGPSAPGADRLIGGVQVSLSPGQCLVLNVQGPASPPGNNGLYFLGAVADLPNLTVELNEGNNTNSGRQIAIGSGPDFVVTDVKGPASSILNVPFVAQVTVCNQGTAGSVTSIDLVLSTDATIALSVSPAPPTDRIVGGTSGIFLGAGQCQVLSVNGSGFPPGPAGNYFLGAIADVNNLVVELNEGNNASAGVAIRFTP